MSLCNQSTPTNETAIKLVYQEVDFMILMRMTMNPEPEQAEQFLSYVKKCIDYFTEENKNHVIKAFEDLEDNYHEENYLDNKLLDTLKRKIHDIIEQRTLQGKCQT